tara:strand:- start:4968 stop:5480 length:513 start_codon:yes stop_codon:yes gene_type:complete
MSQKQKVLDILKEVSPLPKQGRNNITADNQGKNKGVVLGKVRDFLGRGKDSKAGDIVTARLTETPKYKPLFEEASKLMKQHNPNFKFTSIQINENQKTSKHKDGYNVGKSYIIGLGDYTGGEVRLYTKDGKSHKDINIKNRWATFDGSELEHETLPFKGQRFTLVYYSVN